MKKYLILLTAFLTIAVAQTQAQQTAANDPLLIPYRKGDKWGFCTKDKKIVIPCTYDDARRFYDGLAWVRKKDETTGENECGYINKKGEIIIPCKYNRVWDFSDGLAKVELNSKYGFVDKLGKEVVACKYDDAWLFFEGLAKVEINSKWGYIDKTGKEIIPCVYDKLWRDKN